METRQAEAVQDQMTRLHADIGEAGQSQSVCFTDVGNRGADVYVVQYEHAAMDWRIGLAAVCNQPRQDPMDEAILRLFAGLPLQGPGADPETIRVLRSVMSDLPARPVVADFGCGTGRSSLALAAALQEA